MRWKLLKHDAQDCVWSVNVVQVGQQNMPVQQSYVMAPFEASQNFVCKG